MKNRLSLWTVTGISIAVTTAIVSKTILASLLIGAGTAMLLMIVTNLEVDRKIRN